MQFKVRDWTSPDFGSLQDLVNKTMNAEAIRVERELGVPFEQLATGIAVGMRTSVTAFVFILRKREEPTLTFDSPEMSWSEEEFDLIITDADKARQEAAAEAAAQDPRQDGAVATETATVVDLTDSVTSNDD